MNGMEFVQLKDEFWKFFEKYNIIGLWLKEFWLGSF